MENDDIIQIKTETLNSVLNFLGTRPYKEVAALIQSVITDVNTLRMQEVSPTEIPEEPDEAAELGESEIEVKESA